MSLVLQLTLCFFSGVIFLTLLHRAFSHGEKAADKDWFSSLDVAVALSISALFVYLAFNLFISIEQPFTEKDIPGSLLTQVIFGGIILSYVRWRKISLGQFFGIAHGPWWKSIGLGIVLMIGIFPFVGILASLLNSEPSQEQQAVKFFRETNSLQARLLLAFMAVVVAPFVEEVVFRGLLYRVFKGYFGKYAAMFFTSVLFASIHGNIPTLLPLTLLAFALTAGLEWSGSLWVCIAMHATFNGISLLLLLYSGTP